MNGFNHFGHAIERNVSGLPLATTRKMGKPVYLQKSAQHIEKAFKEEKAEKLTELHNQILARKKKYEEDHDPIGKAVIDAALNFGFDSRLVPDSSVSAAFEYFTPIID